MSMHLGEAEIREGALGSDVKRLQEILTGQGYNTGGVDGIWGTRTTDAVKAFQSAKGLIPDGIAGPLTWAALNGQLPTAQPLAVSPPPTAPRPPAMMFAGIAGLSPLMLIGVAAVGLVLFGMKK